MRAYTVFSVGSPRRIAGMTRRFCTEIMYMEYRNYNPAVFFVVFSTTFPIFKSLLLRNFAQKHALYITFPLWFEPRAAL